MSEQSSLNPEFQEKIKIESYRNAMISEIRKALRGELGISRKGSAHLNQLDQMIAKYNEYSEKLGLPQKTKDDFRIEVQTAFETNSKKNKDIPDHIIDTAIEEAIDNLQRPVSDVDNFNTPVPPSMIDPYADTPVPPYDTPLPPKENN